MALHTPPTVINISAHAGSLRKNMCIPSFIIIAVYMCACFLGLATMSPYVGMVRFQEGGSNQCISINLHGDIIARKQILASKST